VPAPLRDALAFFLLAFPALFAIVNPLGGAFLFLSATRALGPGERERLARWVAIHSLVLLVASFFVGGYVLSFFGISMPVLRVAGGIVISMTGWRLLNAEEGEAATHRVRLADPSEAPRVAFFPLTLPITVGPGTISIAVALGTSRPPQEGPLAFVAGAAATTLLLCGLIYVLYRFSDRVGRVIGPTGSAVLVRIASFLLFCVGIQVLWTGASALLAQSGPG
jgi:multiple antibiotic resistance protein